MKKALLIQNGTKRLVSADDIQKRYGNTSSILTFICPFCQQPLHPAAMASGRKQQAHFRHEPNNPKAHQCELFAEQHGYSTVQQRIPMPLFIKKSTSRDKTFLIECGFRKLKGEDLSLLSKKDARVKIGEKEYCITPQRFGQGLRRLPLEGISLNCESAVQLINSPLDLSITWGKLENAQHAMVFIREHEDSQGRRINIGDAISWESNLYLLSPKTEEARIYSSFTEAEKVGSTISNSKSQALYVYQVSLTKKDPRYKRGKDFLSRCGIKIEELNSTPELIWPPSLKEDGTLKPLFKNSYCIFSSCINATASLYIHTDKESSTKVPIIPGEESDYGYAFVSELPEVGFVTTQDSPRSSTILLSPYQKTEDNLSNPVEPYKLTCNTTNLILQASTKIEVTYFNHNHTITHTSLDEKVPQACCKIANVDRIQVQQRLHTSRNQLFTIFEKSYMESNIQSNKKQPANKKKALIFLNRPRDVTFANARKNLKNPKNVSRDKQRALIRKQGNEYFEF